jgi:hypothetical protein
LPWSRTSDIHHFIPEHGVGLPNDEVLYAVKTAVLTAMDRERTTIITVDAVATQKPQAKIMHYHLIIFCPLPLIRDKNGFRLPGLKFQIE